MGNKEFKLYLVLLIFLFLFFYKFSCKGVRRQVLPSWGGLGLTLLRLAILPSGWVLAVLEEATSGDTSTGGKMKFSGNVLPLNIFFCVEVSPLVFPPTVPP